MVATLLNVVRASKRLDEALTSSRFYPKIEKVPIVGKLFSKEHLLLGHDNITQIKIFDF